MNRTVPRGTGFQPVHFTSRTMHGLKTRAMKSAVLAACALICHIAPAFAADAPTVTVPNGYVVERVAYEPQVKFPMFAAFDDRGRLFVADSSGLDLYAELVAHTHKCRVSVLHTRDAEGRFQKANVFVDGLVFPMGLACRDGRLVV